MSTYGSDHRLGSIEWVREINQIGAPYPILTPEEYYSEPFNQKDRFNTSADLVNYVCAFYPNNHPSRRSYYDPICPFPYVPAGWNLPVSNSTTANITFGDCSLKMSDASADYNTICAIYFTLAFIPIPILLWDLKRVNEMKEPKKQSKPFWLIKKPNTGEQLIYWSLFLSTMHSGLTIDIMGWALRVPSILGDLLMGSCYGMAISIMACLVTSWITIIDGGKSKRTPKWAQALRYTASITIFITEIGMTFAERRVGHASNYDLAAMDGNVVVMRYLVFVFFFGLYGAVAFFYCLKILGMLMSGKKGMSSQSKKIVKLCAITVICCLVLCGLRLFPVPFSGGATLIMPAPCNDINPNQFINVSILFFQYILLFAVYPGKKKKKKVNPLTGKEEKKSQLLFRSTTGSSTVEESGSSGVTESEQAPADKGTDEAAKT